VLSATAALLASVFDESRRVQALDSLFSDSA
jgi:hypothetical protein